MADLIRLLEKINFISLLIGSILLTTGWITLKFPPKNIIMLYGYRTQRSMKNQENWRFAQVYASKEMIRGGWVMIVYALSGLIFPTALLTDTITGTVLMIIIFVVLIARTETSLKRFENQQQE